VKDLAHEDPENLAFWEDVINDPLLHEGANELDPAEFMMELEAMSGQMKLGSKVSSSQGLSKKLSSLNKV
jgi:hypothetical protein